MNGLVLMQGESGIIKCEACGQILSYLSSEHLSYGYLHLLCRCGGGGYLKFGTKAAHGRKALADERQNSLKCPECRRSWLAPTEAVRGFAFYFECTCGIFAENRYLCKRNLSAELYFS